MIEFIGPLYHWLQQFTIWYTVILRPDTPRELFSLSNKLNWIALNYQLFLASRIASVPTTAQKTHPLPNNGYVNPHRKHLLRHPFYCCVRVLRALPKNGSTLLLVVYLLRASLPSRSLATGLHVTVCLLAIFGNLRSQKTQISMKMLT
jgi:hypothetical protein